MDNIDSDGTDWSLFNDSGSGSDSGSAGNGWLDKLVTVGAGIYGAANKPKPKAQKLPAWLLPVGIIAGVLVLGLIVMRALK